VSYSVEFLAFLQCCAALLARLYRRLGTTHRSHQQGSSSPYVGSQDTMTKSLLAPNFETVVLCYNGPGGVFGIATDYGLDGPGIDSR